MLGCLVGVSMGVTEKDLITHSNNYKEENKTMDIKDFTKQMGEFLKAENVDPTATVTVCGEAKITHNEKYDTDRLHIPVKLKDQEFIFDCSRTNSRTISEILGEDTSLWVNSTLTLDTYKTKTSDGAMVKAINVASATKQA